MKVQHPMVTATHWNGVAVWEVCTDQAVARVSCLGGQLLSWQPRGHEEVLWCSPQLQPPRALRGGVPLCWPWFGAHPTDPRAPAHGLARTAHWQLDHAHLQDDGRVELALSPPQPLHAGLRVQQRMVIGTVLEQRVTSHNVGERSEPLSQALHGYWAVADVQAVQVHGLDGCDYIDALASGRVGHQVGSWQCDPVVHGGRCDRMYDKVPGALVLHDLATGRRLQLQLEGGQSWVLWTPGRELGLQMADVGPQWPHYLCVEAANVGTDARVLAPGQVHTLKQVVQLLD